MARCVDLYWFRIQNFGDRLNELVLPSFGVRVDHAMPRAAAVVGIGSILQIMPPEFDGIILGTGFMWADDSIEFRSAEVVAVRGQLTAERCRAAKRTALGDPGLLVGRLIDPPDSPSYTLGLVPHYVDSGDLRIAALTERYPQETKVIDIRDPPEVVLREMSKCAHILSSSLHGLIAADALGIPNSWVVLSDKVLGDGFKFRDYFSAFADDRQAMTLDGTETLSGLISGMYQPTRAVSERIDELAQLFSNLARSLLQ